MHKRIIFNLVAALMLSISPSMQADETTPVEEYKDLRQDLEALKQGQETLGKDVTEIKKLLQALQPPRVRPIDAVLQVGG